MLRSTDVRSRWLTITPAVTRRPVKPTGEQAAPSLQPPMLWDPLDHVVVADGGGPALLSLANSSFRAVGTSAAASSAWRATTLAPSEVVEANRHAALLGDVRQGMTRFSKFSGLMRWRRWPNPVEARQVAR